MGDKSSNDRAEDRSRASDNWTFTGWVRAELAAIGIGIWDPDKSGR